MSILSPNFPARGASIDAPPDRPAGETEKSMGDPTPTEVRRLPEVRRLRVIWDDGHRAEYDYDYLRGYCPCAECQGHSVIEVRFHSPSTSVTPIEIVPVGNYGISIHWSDRHATGIYRFDFLRQICPCQECVAAREPKEKEGES